MKKTEATETRGESSDKREPERREDKRDDKRRAFDTLTDDNPLIFRGMD